MSVLVVRVGADEVESCSDWLFQLGARAIEEKLDGDEPSLVAGFANDDAALAARSVLQERWPCRLEDTGDEREWRDQWLRYLEPIQVGDVLIHAPWHDVSGIDGPSISIDPGRAFGSGHHPTTQLAIEALQSIVDANDRVLDAGCGTGILSIAAARLGASRVTGVDLDHDILAVAEANIAANQVEDLISLSEVSLLDLTERFDVTVANIVIGDLRPLLPALVERTERAIIVSGFLDDQLERLITDVAVRVEHRTEREGWGAAVLLPDLP